MLSRTKMTALLFIVAILLFMAQIKRQSSLSETQAVSPASSANKRISENPRIPSHHQNTLPDHTLNKNAAKANEIKKDLTEDQLALMCKIKTLRSTIPSSGKVQIFTTRMSPVFGEKNQNVAWIKSSDCPSGTYSILYFSDEGEVSKEIDCRKTDFTELSVLSGEQGDIQDALSNETDFNMAISGNGYFVLQCPDSHLLLTRDGHFFKDDQGHLRNREACTLVDSEGSAIDSDGLSITGCNSKKKCVGTIDPAFDEVQGLEYKNSYSFTEKLAIPPIESLTKVGPKILRPTFFLNSLENIKSEERGPTSVLWSNHPVIDLDSLNCL